MAPFRLSRLGDQTIGLAIGVPAAIGAGKLMTQQLLLILRSLSDCPCVRPE
jgi:hypothetical protein